MRPHGHADLTRISPVAHQTLKTCPVPNPAGLAFLATADWGRPWIVAKRLMVPAVALIVAFSTLYYLEHMN